jgi:cullin-associated NEDD8-dissociated protein 1
MVRNTCLCVQDIRTATIERFLNDVKKGKTENAKLLGLYCLGEIGRRIDLSGNKEVKSVIFNSMEASTSEDIRTAASIALGNVAIGSLEKFLPEILSEIKKNPKKKYLLLGSLREVIVRQSGTKEGISQLLKFFDQFSGILLGIDLTL